MSPVVWRPRAVSLEPTGAVAEGAVASLLARRLGDRADRWRGVAGPGLLVVLGDGVPWVDGLTWLGADPEAPGALWPTDRTCSPHPVRVLTAWREAHPEVSGPWAVWPGGVVGLAEARPLTPSWIAARWP